MRLLICTDLDRTLLPNGTQPESPHARERFARFCQRGEVTLVYVSGRNKKLVEKAITCYRLPQPALVISDVGTMIYDLRNGDWHTLHEWEIEIAPDWNGMTSGDLSKLFHDIKSLNMQERDKQNIYKLSYYFSLHQDKNKLIEIIQQRLDQFEVNASLIWSVDDPAGVGLLDITPRSATKLHAIEFIRNRLGFSLEETIFAGDSGNDLPVLISPIQAILVANATESVREEALAGAQSSGTVGAIYFARGNSFGNGNYSTGIIEGIIHYKPELLSWFTNQN
jgi:sucrose-6-phosphatase